MSEKQALSYKQALRCETAQEHICKCRCHGALHGVNRCGDNPCIDWFQSLPADDPHRLPTKAEKREATNAKNREKTRIKNEKIMAAFAKLYAKS